MKREWRSILPVAAVLVALPAGCSTGNGGGSPDDVVSTPTASVEPSTSEPSQSQDADTKSEGSEALPDSSPSPPETESDVDNTASDSGARITQEEWVAGANTACRDSIRAYEDWKATEGRDAGPEAGIVALARAAAIAAEGIRSLPEPPSALTERLRSAIVNRAVTRKAWAEAIVLEYADDAENEAYERTDAADAELEDVAEQARATECMVMIRDA